MKQSSIQQLNDPVWVEIEGDPLKVKIRPSAGAETGALLFAPNDEKAIRKVCSKLFLDFEGYTDSTGKAIKNDLAARVELYGWPPVREAIARECDRINAEAAEGEGSADSD
jgi:hypothetical protein